MNYEEKRIVRKDGTVHYRIIWKRNPIRHWLRMQLLAFRFYMHRTK